MRAASQPQHRTNCVCRRRALAAPAAAVPASVPPPAAPDALAVANARITELTAELATIKEALTAEQAKVAALSKGETQVSAGAAPAAGKKVPATFWAK